MSGQKTGTIAEHCLATGLRSPPASDFVGLSTCRRASLRSRLLPVAMISVGPASAAESEAALELLFAKLPPHERSVSIADVQNAVRQGRVKRHGLLIARVDGIAEGAVLYILQEDRTAFVWPPGTNDRPDSATIGDALLGELIQQIQEAAAWIGQCLIDPHWHEERAALVRSGFAHLTDLRFLVCRVDQDSRALLQPAPVADAPFEIVNFQAGVNEARFASLIERTYVDTRDCPELRGLRSGEEALVGHRMSGEFDPSLWLLFARAGKDAGVLLINDHPRHQTWEVVYMGVAWECRGHGVGQYMLTEGLRRARAAKRPAVVLAVDVRNDYASDLYDQFGFVETERKSVHVFVPRRAPQRNEPA